MFGNIPIKVDYSSCSQRPNPVYALISLDPLSWDNWRSHSCIKVKVAFFLLFFFEQLAVITINLSPEYNVWIFTDKWQGTVTQSKNHQTVSLKTLMMPFIWLLLLNLFVTWFVCFFSMFPVHFNDINITFGAWDECSGSCYRIPDTGGEELISKKERKRLLLGIKGSALEKREVVSRQSFTEIFLQLSDFSTEESRPVFWHADIGRENVIKEKKLICLSCAWLEQPLNRWNTCISKCLGRI